MIRFIAKYYSLVTDDVIEKTFEANSMKEAYEKARKLHPGHECEIDFDLYMDIMMVESAVIDDGLKTRKII